ncbi:hypothetical protein SDC9_145377 [bioreactor metagenome]|uniref:Uncharacterized protein n=1 Tax=bioreactor metagenome TaxID=1076179 RepID=A0A645E894_9ZZZZ
MVTRAITYPASASIVRRVSRVRDRGPWCRAPRTAAPRTCRPTSTMVAKTNRSQATLRAGTMSNRPLPTAAPVSTQITDASAQPIASSWEMGALGWPGLGWPGLGWPGLGWSVICSVVSVARHAGRPPCRPPGGRLRQARVGRIALMPAACRALTARVLTSRSSAHCLLPGHLTTTA